jgi:cytoskeletal protein RodZ
LSNQMSTHDTETGKDQNPFEQQSASIDSQHNGVEQQILPSQTIHQPLISPRGPKRNRWFLITLIIVLVALLLVVSIGTVTLLLQRPHPVPSPTPNPTITTQPSATTQPTATPSTPTPSPITEQWIAVLNGYKITSLAAAPSNSNVLYACAVPPGLSPNLAGVETVLRSADLGKHWQDIGSRANMSRGCELAINPTDSYEIYVSTSSNPATNPAVPAYVLKHTSNGGDSWETFQPTVNNPGQQNINWQGSPLYTAGNRLFSLQWLSIPLTPTPAGNQGSSPTGSTRLLVSTNGGHTWGVLDTQLSKTQQSVWTYAVNPLDTNIMYEIVGLPGAVPGQFPGGELYKSTDGGTTWTLQSSLKQITGFVLMQDMLIVSEKPDMVYLTNTPCSSSQAFQTGTGALFQQRAGGGFSLCMSSDGGTNWRNITAPSNLALSMVGGPVDPQGRFYDIATNTPNSVPEIWRYDPTTNAWSKIAALPAGGSLQAVTSIRTNGSIAMWSLATVQGKYVLYRYEV